MYVDRTGLTVYSVNDRYSRNYTLYVSPQWLDAGETTAAIVFSYLNPLIGAGFVVTSGIALRLAGYREVGYSLNSNELGVVAGLIEGLAKNRIVKTAGKAVGIAVDLFDVGDYARNWFIDFDYQIEEAIYNQFDRSIWISDTRDLVDRKFIYAMNNITYMIATGKIEVKKAIDVFGKDAFYKDSVLGMVTYQYDPLTGKNKYFHQDDYYFFILDCDNLINSIASLEKTIKQGVWLD